MNYSFRERGSKRRDLPFLQIFIPWFSKTRSGVRRKEGKDQEKVFLSLIIRT
jgi:hypothetical protein